MTLFAVEDEMLTTEAVQRGAQGYLSKAHFGSYLVPQSLRNMIQRKVVEEKFFIEQSRSAITLNSISDAVIVFHDVTASQAIAMKEGQGYFFSRPLAAEQFTTLLATGMANA